MDTPTELQAMAPVDRLRALRELQEQLPGLIRQAGLEARADGVPWAMLVEAGQFVSLEAARHAIAESPRERSRTGLTDDLPGVGVQEAARRLGLTRQQLYAAIRKGEVQAETHTSPGGRPLTRIISPLPPE